MAFVMQSFKLILQLATYAWVVNQITLQDAAYPQNTVIVRNLVPTSNEPANAAAFWAYLKTTLAPHLYPVRDTRDHMFDWSEYGYFSSHLRLVGGVRLRKVDVSSDSCEARRFVAKQARHALWNGTRWRTDSWGRFDTIGKECFDDLDDLSERNRDKTFPSLPNNGAWHEPTANDIWSEHHSLGKITRATVSAACQPAPTPPRLVRPRLH